MRYRHLSAALLLAALAIIAGCGKAPVTAQTDVIIVGAGIAGLAAALEAADTGADVIVVDANSVGGGHAVRAGGFALVNTALQRDKGINDSAALATQELLDWGEDADADWVKRYAEDSGTEVYDWLVAMGVEFKLILPTPESSLPRFHFTQGTAVHVVVPMMREALSRPNIRFLWNIAADELLLTDGQVVGIHAVNVRTGSSFQLYSGSVVLATGGFQSNTAMVNQHWRGNRSRPGRLLIGSGQFATGSGYELAAGAGANLQRMDRQVTFVNGIPNPRDNTRRRGLTVSNRQAILINETGNRFVDESLPSKNLEQAVFTEVQKRYWMVFDASGARKLGVRGATWLNTDSVRSEIFTNSDLTQTAASIEALAEHLQVAPENLRHSIDDYNRSARNPLTTPPYYALQLHPLTRKSLGGPAISETAQVLNSNNEVIPGLYAAGELTGVAGINGSYGGSGTFLGPSVYLGRIAGAAAAVNSQFPLHDPDPNIVSTPRLNQDIDGYWHYNVVHEAVQTRQLDCDSCHNKTPMAEVGSSKAMLTRLSTCESCH